VIKPFPSGTRVEEIDTGDATIHTRVGGTGPAVIMLHGFADTGDMWAELAAALIGKHTVVVPDLRGMGLSSHPPAGYDKKTQGQDIARALDKLGIEKADLVTHDIGNMVGYAFAAQFPARVTRWVALDAPLPGIGPWDEILKSPMLWHFNFRGPDMERLVARPRAHLSRSFLERTVGQSQSNRRGDARSLRRSLRETRRHALGLRAVRSLHPGRRR